jgi:hypothetical protein
MKMASEPNELGPVDPDNLPYPDYRDVLSALPNAELLNALDLALLELEKRCSSTLGWDRRFSGWPTRGSSWP